MSLVPIPHCPTHQTPAAHCACSISEYGSRRAHVHLVYIPNHSSGDYVSFTHLRFLTKIHWNPNASNPTHWCLHYHTSSSFPRQPILLRFYSDASESPWVATIWYLHAPPTLSILATLASPPDQFVSTQPCSFASPWLPTCILSFIPNLSLYPRGVVSHSSLTVTHYLHCFTFFAKSTTYLFSADHSAACRPWNFHPLCVCSIHLKDLSAHWSMCVHSTPTLSSCTLCYCYLMLTVWYRLYDQDIRFEPSKQNNTNRKSFPQSFTCSSSACFSHIPLQLLCKFNFSSILPMRAFGVLLSSRDAYHTIRATHSS